MPDAELNGTSIYFEEAGRGPRAFLMFNGNGETLRCWGEIVEALAGTGRVIRWDMRGVGRTGLPEEPFPLETLAEDALALLDHLGIERAILVAHAFGGRVAQVFARDHPERVRAIVLCGTGGQFPPLPSRATADIADRSLSREVWEEAWLAQFCGPSFREEQPERAARLLDQFWEERQAPQGVRFQREAARLTPSPTYWGKVAAPALLLYGTEDRQGHPQNANDLAERLPDARLVWIEGAGHLAIRERPELVIEEIHRFVQEREL